MAALAGVRVELPAVIGAFDGRAVEAPKRKRKRTVRADVAQRKRLSGGVAPQHQRNFEQHRALEFSPRNSSLRSAGYQNPHRTSAAGSRGFEGVSSFISGS